MRKERLWLIGKIVVSVSLITCFFQKIDIGQLVNYFTSCHLIWLCVAIIIFFLGLTVTTYKWQILLNTLKVEVAFKKLLSLNLIGMFYSFFVPGGQISGEVIKGIKLTNVCRRSSEVLISIAMDKLTGILALVILALVGIFTQFSLIKDYKLLMMILAILLIITFFALLILNKQLASLAERTTHLIFERERLRFFKKYISPVWNSLKAYKEDISVLGKSLAYSFVFQMVGIAISYVVALSLKIQIPFNVFIWIVPIVSIVQSLPISISGIGVREGAFIFFLAQYEVPTSQALALSLIIFGIMIIGSLVGGLIELRDFWVGWKKFN
jgi:hypothetical protein